MQLLLVRGINGDNLEDLLQLKVINYKSLRNMKNYTLFNKDRDEIKGGGFAIYTRNDLRTYFPKEKKLMETKSEQVWVNIKLGSSENILISCSYRPLVSGQRQKG